SVTPRRKGIVVTELPYNVGPEKVIEAIKKLVQAKKLQGISDIKNLTDRHKGLQLVIEIKSGFIPESILEQLYKSTPMESSFGINAVALVDGQPRTLGLKEMLEVYLGHRFDVVRRRTQFRRGKAADRLHLLEGMLLALLDIDEVIQLVRASENRGAAKERLMTVFDLSDPQATYILDLTLGRLTKYDRLEVEKEITDLRAIIDELDAILADDQLLRKVVGDELAEMAQTFGTPRRTVLLESSGQTATAASPLEVSDDPCWALLSATGLLARTSDDSPLGDVDRRVKHDTIISAVRTTARGEIGIVTASGRVRRISVLELPGLPPTAQSPNLQGGMPISELVSLDAPALALMTFDDDVPGLALGTRQGVVKRVRPDHLARDEWELISLAAGDVLVGAVMLATGDEELAFVTSDAQLLHFPASGVRPQGRAGGGIAGVKLASGQKAVSFGAVSDIDNAFVVTVAGSADALPGTQTGAVKVSPMSIYPAKGRATGGVRCHRLLKGEDGLLLAWVGDGAPMATATSGSPVDLPEVSDRRDGSGVPATQPIHAVAGPPRALPSVGGDRHPPVQD
ncbi:MAG: topoisomerase, partial [Aeromicrobium sp.]|nr:topoisomerase [Aeromicrobium sp.]